MNSKLYYDANCPICRNYVRILKSRIAAPDTITFIPIEADVNEFRYTAFDGNDYNGQVAIDMLCTDHPEILKFFFMLPTKYRTTALHAAYKAASSIRTAIASIGRPRKPCNCGKKK